MRVLFYISCNSDSKYGKHESLTLDLPKKNIELARKELKRAYGKIWDKPATVLTEVELEKARKKEIKEVLGK